MAVLLTGLCYAATLVTELVRITDVSHAKVLSVQKVEGRTNCLTLEVSKGKTSLGRIDFWERQEVNSLTEQINMMAGKAFPHSRNAPDPSARWSLEPYNQGGVELTIGSGKEQLSIRLDAEGAKTLSRNLSDSLKVLKR